MIRRIRHRAFGCVCFYFLIASWAIAASAADWPTYRGDSRRSGYTPESLPDKLSLQWTYKSREAPRCAWPGRDTRMPFDRAHHTVVSGDLLFFGSTADCKVYALDTATGAERWTFFTGGPVRFAPVVWKDRVFLVSDDGFLYCLSAGDGRLLWKKRGGPREDMLLGNDRMISSWPARGGPVVVDDILYFAAGIWPSEGIYLYAVEAATGKVLWCNDSSGFIRMKQPHAAMAKSGVSAQGYLAADLKRILVPTGRGVPAVFDRSNGKFLYFHLNRNGKRGGSAVAVGDDLFLNGGSVFDLKTGAHYRWIAGCSPHLTVTSPEGLIRWSKQEIGAFKVVEGEREFRKKTVKTKLLEEVWNIPCPVGGASLIMAGKTMVSGGKSGIALVDIEAKKMIWSEQTDGLPLGLAVANKRLYVSTDKGTIHCFAGRTVGGAKEIKPQPTASPYASDEVFAAAAEQIIKTTGISEGYCLDLGCGDGALAYALAKRSKLQIYAIDSDPEMVALARKKLDAAGLYGVRVTVHQGQPANTGYPNYFANLIVSGRSVTMGPGVVPAKEMQRLLRPYGGTAYIGELGAMRKTVRGALKGAGTWTHQYCDPANSNCSDDTLAKGPLGMLWFTDFNFQMSNRHGRGPAPLFLDGRLFVEGYGALRCIDAYNGHMLWEYSLPDVLKAYNQGHIMGVSGTGSNFCVTHDAVYVLAGGKCLRIEPATGKLLAEFEPPGQPPPTGLGQTDGKGGVWGYLAYADGLLFGTLADTEHVVRYCYRRSNMRNLHTESKLLFALHAKTGKLEWSYKPEHSIRNNSIAVGKELIYLIDRPLAAMDRLDRRRQPADKRTPHSYGTLLALNSVDGKPVWKCSEDIYGTMLALSQEHNVLVMSYQNTGAMLPSESGSRMTAFRASDGKRLWDVEANYGSRLILNGRTIYAQPGAWDLLEGKRKDFEFKRAKGCGTLSGSRNLLLFRSGTLGYSNLLTYQGVENYGPVRPGCWINVITAGGLVLMPDATDRCTCSYLIKASIALQPRTEQ